MLLEILWIPGDNPHTDKTQIHRIQGYSQLEYVGKTKSIRITLRGHHKWEPSGNMEISGKMAPSGLALQLIAHSALADIPTDHFRHGQILSGKPFDHDLRELPAGEAIGSLAHLDWWNHLNPLDAEPLSRVGGKHSHLFGSRSEGFGFNLKLSQAIILRGIFTPKEILRMDPKSEIRVEWEKFQPDLKKPEKVIWQPLRLASSLQIDAETLPKLLKDASHAKAELPQPRDILDRACELATRTKPVRLTSQEQKALLETILETIPPESGLIPILAQWHLRHDIPVRLGTLNKWLAAKTFHHPAEKPAMVEMLGRMKPTEDFHKSLHTMLEHDILPISWAADKVWVLQAWKKKKLKAVDMAALIVKNPELCRLLASDNTCISKQVLRAVAATL